MDYEQKYKEALEMAKVAALNGHQNLMEGIFPELKESEDEKIRKEIIATIHLYYGEPLESDANKMIAWLEKQKPIKWSEEDDKMSDYIIGIVDGSENTTCNELIEVEHWIKSIKERICNV